MAHMTQAQKQIFAAALKIALKDYPEIKYSLSVRDHSEISCRITKGPQYLDPIGKGDISVNQYHINSHYKDNQEAAKVLNLINDVLHVGYHNNSDCYSDYHDVSWYININIGRWDKPYEVV